MLKNTKVLWSFLCTALCLLSTVNLAYSQSNESAKIKFIKADGNPAYYYDAASVVRVQLDDIELNTSSSNAESIDVLIYSETETAGETLTLTETDVNSGVFEGNISTQTTSTATENDSKLQVARLQRIWVNYSDVEYDIIYAATLANGTISTDTQWSKEKSPYFVTADIIIAENVSLTINAGVEVIVLPNQDENSNGVDPDKVEFTVRGSLIAEGTEADSVIFRSIRQTNVDIRNLWTGITSDASATINLNYCIYQNASNLLRYTSDNSEGNTLNIDLTNSSIRYIDSGLYPRRIKTNFYANNNTVTNLFNYFIYSSDSSQSTFNITNSTFENNSSTNTPLVNISYASSFSLDNCNITFSETPHSFGRTNIKLYGISDINITNSIFDYGDNLIYANNCTSVIIDNNIITNTEETAILTYSPYTRIKNNVISSTYTAIELRGFSNNEDILISNNDIIDNNLGFLLTSDLCYARINYNNIHSNVLDISTTTINPEYIDAKFNWWGEKTTAEYNKNSNLSAQENISDYFDFNRYSKVNYASYLDAKDGNPVTNTTTAETSFLRQNNKETLYLNAYESLIVQVIDEDQNRTTSKDTVHIKMKSSNSDEMEEVVLEETEANSGIFRKLIPTLPSSSFTINNGTFETEKGSTIDVIYRDLTDDFGNLKIHNSSIPYGFTILDENSHDKVYLRKMNSPYLLTGYNNYYNGISIEEDVVVFVLPYANEGSDKYYDKSGLDIYKSYEYSGPKDKKVLFKSLDEKSLDSWSGISFNNIADSVYNIHIYNAEKALSIRHYRNNEQNFYLSNIDIDNGKKGFDFYSEYMTYILTNININSLSSTAIKVQGNNESLHNSNLIVDNLNVINSHSALYAEFAKNITLRSCFISSDVDFTDNNNRFEIFQTESVNADSIIIENGNFGFKFYRVHDISISNSSISKCKNGISTQESRLTLKNSNLFDNTNRAVELSNNSLFEADSLLYNTITNNDVGIEKRNNGLTFLRNNSLHSNSSYEITCLQMSDIDAQYNWWGEENTNLLNNSDDNTNLSFIYDGFDQLNFGKVDYSNWLSAPPNQQSQDYTNATLQILDENYQSIESISTNQNVIIQLLDLDRNISTSKDTIMVYVSSDLEPNFGYLTLTETEDESGIFETNLNTETSNVSIDDGLLQLEIGNFIYIRYNDPHDQNGFTQPVRNEYPYGYTVIGGEFNEDLILSRNHSPYFVDRDIKIADTFSLIVEAGTQIVVSDKDQNNLLDDIDRVEIEMNGFLSMIGTEANPIRIIGSNKEGFISWSGIKNSPMYLTHLEYVTLEGANVLLDFDTFNDDYSNEDQTILDIKYCTFRNTVTAIDYDNFTGYGVIDHTTFEDVTNTGIYILGRVDETSNIAVTNSHFEKDIISRAISVYQVGNLDIDSNTFSTDERATFPYMLYFSNIKNEVLVRNNKFINCLKSMYGIFSSGNKNISIKGNLFEKFENTPIRIQTSNVVIEDNEFYDINDYVIEISNNDHSTHIIHNNFYTFYGLYFENHSNDTSIRQNTFESTFAIYNTSENSSELDAQYNWWGFKNIDQLENATTHPSNMYFILDGHDNNMYSTVNYSNWLTEPTFNNFADPIQPVLPSNGAINVSEPILFVWNKDLKASKYNIQLSTNDDFSGTFKNVTISDTTNTIVANLEANTTYYWRVRGVSDDIYSIWGPTFSFTTISNEDALHTFSVPLRLQTSNSNTTTLHFGALGTSTDETDPYDVKAASSPTNSSFDPYFTKDGVNYYSDFRAYGNETNTWTLNLNTANSNYPVLIQWDYSDFSNSTFYLVAGTQEIDMKRVSHFEITDSSVKQIVIRQLGDLNFSQNYSKGWNLVSLPVQSDETNYKNIFTQSIENSLFGFEGVYTSPELLEANKGYWLRFNKPESVSFEGSPLKEATLDLNKGWNLIGSLATPFTASSIIDPNGIIIRNSTFEYNGYYRLATQIEPGKAYWIKTEAAGQVEISTSILSKEKAPSIDKELKLFTSILISNEDLSLTPLFFDAAKDIQLDVDNYPMPPKAPNGAIDARFNSGSRLLNSSTVSIDLSQTATSEKLQLTLQNQTPNKNTSYLVEQFDKSDMIKSEEVNLNTIIELNKNTTRIQITNLDVEQAETQLPTQLALAQNYPNPFNPTTQIQFELPETSFVRLDVFNIQGQRVATLIDQQEHPAGQHSISFDASNLPSGVYLYRINTNQGSITRKMMLIK